MLNQPCISEINSSWSCCMIIYYTMHFKKYVCKKHLKIETFPTFILVIFEDLICLDLSSDMATVLVTICFMSRYFINLCYLAQMVLNILLPWRWLGMLQVTWCLRCLNLCILLKLFIPFPVGPYFLLMLFTLYIYIFFTCLPHGSPFYNFLKVGSSLFGPFLYIYSRAGDHPYSVFQVLESLLSPSSQTTCFHYYLCFYWS